MSEHLAQIEWKRSSQDFRYRSYNRDHKWKFPGGTIVSASAAPAFLGNTACVDPEEAYVASLSACHMLTFLALCAKERITVDHYSDTACGFLEKNAAGKLVITRVELKPVVEFSLGEPTGDTLARLHKTAHGECFIANSVQTQIDILV